MRSNGRMIFAHSLAGLLAAAASGLAAGAAGAQPVKVWETPGFMTPESVILDADRDLLYVSNVNGQPNEKDGNGFISKVNRDGTIADLHWVDGLDAPKGMVIDGGTLYVSDIDRLVAIDIDAGTISASHEAPGAKFLNDTAVDAEGRVYVSDMADNAIWRLEDGNFSLWLQDPALESPNGLRVEGDTLLVAAWGVMTDGFATETPGHMKAVSLSSKAIESLGSGQPVGNLDGLEPDGRGGYLVTDWVAGALYRIAASGEAERLLDLNQGSADLEFVEAERLAIIPMMADGTVAAYRID